MMLGELSPGGVGTGLYSMLVMVVLAVFVAGLMVGRTPELLGKTIGRREITLAALAMLVTPALVLLGPASPWCCRSVVTPCSPRARTA